MQLYFFPSLYRRGGWPQGLGLARQAATMATEIERKFLLAGDSWRKLSLRQARLAARTAGS